jgi:membrane protein implicated in regulation of membrane protease activity
MINNAWSFVSAWYNLPFSILLALCAVLAVLQTVGLDGEADSEADADVDANVDADADADVYTDVDTDADGDADADHDIEHDGAADGVPGALSLLAYIGMGKAPLAVVLLILFGTVGILGWMLNSLVNSVFGTYPGIAFAGVMPITLIVGGFVSSRISRLIGRALPPVSTTAMRAQAFVGRRGTVISPYVDGKYGLVHLRDQGGTLISVFAVTASPEPIKRGSDVVLVSYDQGKRQYAVAPLSSPS